MKEAYHTHTHTHLLSAPTRARSRPTDAEESAPTWNGAEDRQEQERAKQHPWRPRPGEGSQGRRHSAGLGGHAPRPPRSRCPPAGSLLRALSARRLDARSLGFPLGHRRGVARRGRRLVSSGAARPAHGHPLAGGGGPERPARGRSEAAAGEGGGGGVDSAAAAGLGTTFYIWPLVWGPRGRRGRGGRRWEGAQWRPGRGPGGRGRAPLDKIGRASCRERVSSPV